MKPTYDELLAQSGDDMLDERKLIAAIMMHGLLSAGRNDPDLAPEHFERYGFTSLAERAVDYADKLLLACSEADAALAKVRP
jgi:hypothetical protein